MGNIVATFDTWAKLGYEHSLVIYGERGAVVADYDLEALLSARRNRHVGRPHRHARRWLQDAVIASTTVATRHRDHAAVGQGHPRRTLDRKDRIGTMSQAWLARVA